MLGRSDHTRNVFRTSLHTTYCKQNYCTRNGRKNAIVRKGKGSRLVGGTQLVVFPRPNRPQLKKATSRDPLSSRDPLPLPLPKEVQKGGRGPGRKAGMGSRLVAFFGQNRGQEAWEYHEPGHTNEPGPLAFSQIVLRPLRAIALHELLHELLRQQRTIAAAPLVESTPSESPNSQFSPQGPKIEKIQDRPPGLKFSIEIEIFKRAPHQNPCFCGRNSEGPGLKISSEIEIFNLA